MDLNEFILFFNESDHFSKNNGLKLTVLLKGYAEVEMDFDSTYCNFMGTLHGGAFYTLADVAAGSALISHGKMCVTLNASINYIKPATEGKIKACATVLQYGGKIGICEVKILNEAGDTLCICTVTMYITSNPVKL